MNAKSDRNVLLRPKGIRSGSSTPSLTACCLALAFVWAPSGLAQSTSLGQATVGSGSVSVTETSPGQVTVQQGSNKAVLNWNTLNVPQGSGLRYIQPSSQSIILNRVTGGQATQIHGALSGNGQVWILNPHGVLFGPTSTVNLHGLLATTKNISDADFLGGNYRFSSVAGSNGSVVNAGRIDIGSGGYAILAGRRVANSGVIQADLGKIVLGSGESFGLDLHGDGLLRFDVTSQLSPAGGSALIENTGTLRANGGTVQLTARTASDIVGGVVNTSGLIQADSAALVNGAVVIDAGPNATVNVNGSVTARGNAAESTGGRITVVGDAINLGNTASVDASGQAGGGTVLVGGEWQGGGTLQQARNVDVASGAEIRANAITSGDGGTLVVWSDATNPSTSTRVAGRIEALGSGIGRGGRIETSGGSLFVDSATVRAGLGGLWLLDPVDYAITDTAGIVSSLTSGMDVRVMSGGTITVGAVIDTTAGCIATSNCKGSFELIAGGQLLIEESIVLGETISLIASAGSHIQFPRNALGKSYIQTASGNISLTAQTGIFTQPRRLVEGASIRTNSGNVSLNAAILELGGGSISKTGAGNITLNASGYGGSSGNLNNLPSDVAIALHNKAALWPFTVAVDNSNAAPIISHTGSSGSIVVNAPAGKIASGYFDVVGPATFKKSTPTIDVEKISTFIEVGSASTQSIVVAKDFQIVNLGGNPDYSTFIGPSGGRVVLVHLDASTSNSSGKWTDGVSTAYGRSKGFGEIWVVNNFGVPVRQYDGTSIGLGSASSVYRWQSSGGESDVASSTNLIGAYASKNVGTQAFTLVKIQNSGNDFWTGSVAAESGQITTAPLSVTFQGVDKVFDNSKTAFVTPVLSGVRGSDNVAVIYSAARFDDESIGSGKTVSITGIAVAGVDKDNYTLGFNSATTTAAITSPTQVVATSVNSVSTAVSDLKDANIVLGVDGKPLSTQTTVATTSTNTVVGALTREVKPDDNKPENTTLARATQAATAPAPVASTATTAASTPAVQGSAVISVSKPNDPDGKPDQPQATQPVQLASATGATRSDAGTSALLKDLVVISVDRPAGAPVAEVGAATLKPIDTPKAVEDSSDPILLSLNNIKATPGPTAPNQTAAGAAARAATAARSLLPVVPGLLVIETTPPRAATTSGDERLSGSGNRSRW